MEVSERLPTGCWFAVAVNVAVHRETLKGRPVRHAPCGDETVGAVPAGRVLIDGVLTTMVTSALQRRPRTALSSLLKPRAAERPSSSECVRRAGETRSWGRFKGVASARSDVSEGSLPPSAALDDSPLRSA